MKFRQNRPEQLEINITPMIDVVFLLLIFFMVTTTFNRETQLQIVLPEASGEEATVTEPLTVSIDAKGQYFVNEHQVINTDIETLKKAIRQAAGDNSDPQVVVSADGKTSHQSVITTLDALSQVGFVHVTFATSSSGK